MSDACLSTLPEGICLPDGLPMTIERFSANATTAIGGFFFFAFCFWLAHDRPFDLGPGFGLFKRFYPKHWAGMDEAGKGDIASRLHSTMHAIICFGHLLAFNECDNWFKPLANTCTANEFYFSITIGYFAFDYFIVLYYKMTFWQVFLIHHTFAITPYLINNFVPSCGATHFILGIFIQVEVATLILNVQNFLEVTDKSNTAIYKIVFFSSYICWFVVRILVPIWIWSMIIGSVYPHYGFGLSASVSYASASFVMIFCTYVFILVMTPDVLAHVRGTHIDEIIEEEMMGDEDGDTISKELRIAAANDGLRNRKSNLAIPNSGEIRGSMRGSYGPGRASFTSKRGSAAFWAPPEIAKNKDKLTFRSRGSSFALA